MSNDSTRVSTGNDDHFVALHSGFQLGKYELQAVLGQGGFGITYRAWDSALNRAVAIKEYLPSDVAVRVDGSTVRARSRNDQESFQWGLERFLEEARALARFEATPSIVRVYDYLQANGTAYMVMALIDGTPLSAVYRREAPLSEERLKAIMLPILDGLDDVHHAGFLHRDIKPANILIRPNGAAVLIDFGAARQALGERSRSITSVFTPGYAPFEQYTSSGKQGAWTDIYALAATLYHGIAGKAPPQATDRIREDPMEPAVRVGAGKYSQSFLAAIDDGLEVFENRRPQSIGAWRSLLAGLARPDDPPTEVPTLSERGQPLAAPNSSDSPKPKPAEPKAPDPSWLGGGPKRKSRAPLIAATAVALVLAAGGGYAGWNAMESDRTASDRRLKVESETRARAEQQAAQLQAREAARLKAEEEAKAKAAAEARAKAEAEQRARQQAEARAREEAEAKRRAEEQRRADDEARRKAAEDAKRKAEEAARAKVEADARRAAEAAAKARADLERQRGATPATQAAADGPGTQIAPPPPVSSDDVRKATPPATTAPADTQQAAVPAYQYAGHWILTVDCPNTATTPFMRTSFSVSGPRFSGAFFNDGRLTGEIAGTSARLQFAFTGRGSDSFKATFSLSARSATEFRGGGIVMGFSAGQSDRPCQASMTR